MRIANDDYQKLMHHSIESNRSVQEAVANHSTHLDNSEYSSDSARVDIFEHLNDSTRVNIPEHSSDSTCVDNSELSNDSIHLDNSELSNDLIAVDDLTPDNHSSDSDYVLPKLVREIDKPGVAEQAARDEMKYEVMERSNMNRVHADLARWSFLDVLKWLISIVDKPFAIQHDTEMGFSIAP